MDNLAFLDMRRSIRKFDATKKITNDEIYEILKHTSLAPSGNNFQPWKVIVVKNKDIQEKLKEFSFGQTQVSEASAVFLLFGDKNAYDFEASAKERVKVGRLKKEDIPKFIERMKFSLKMSPESFNNEGLKLNVGLFAMQLMLVIRAFGYDSVPMTGVDFAKVKEYLEISDDLIPVLMLPIGIALEEGYPPVRKAVDAILEIIE